MISEASERRLGQGFYWQQLREGDRFRTFNRTITEADLVNFISVTGMLEELFIDAEHGGGAMGGRVVPAALTYSMIEGLLLQTMIQGTGLALLETHSKALRPVRVGDVRIVLMRAQPGTGQRFGDHHHRLAGGARAFQHVAHAAFEPVAVREDHVGGEDARDVVAGGAEEVRVDALADQRLGADGVAADAADHVADHADGGQREGRAAPLGQRRDRQGEGGGEERPAANG